MLVLPPLSMSQVAAAALTVALTVVLAAIGKSIRRKMRAAKLLAPIPGPKGTFLLGLLPELTKNLHRIYDFQVDLMVQCGGRTKVPWNLIGDNMIYLADPKDVEHILSTNMNNYIKSNHLIKSVGDIFGKALLGTNHAHTKDGGAMYRLQRKLVSRVFTTSNFKKFTEGIFHKYALRLVDVINSQNGQVNMHTVASQYTLQTVFDIGCGVPLESIDKELGLKFIESMDYTFGIIAERILLKPYFMYLWWCMLSEYRYKREARVMSDVIDGILCDRLNESDDLIAPRADVLSLCIKKARELQAEGEEMLDIPTLRSIVTALVFAGRDTTSSTILYSFYKLAQFPEQQDKILEELETVDTATLSYEDVKKLKYLDAFVWETMRLHPTSPANLKQAAEDDYLLDGTFIPAGTEILYSSFYLGRHNAKLWGEDQAIFRPERWLEMKTRPTAYEFPVFQGGPRICPGMNMALLEAKIFIAMLVKKFHVEIQEGEQLKDRGYIAAPTLMMEGGLPLQLTPRAAPAC